MGYCQINSPLIRLLVYFLPHIIPLFLKIIRNYMKNTLYEGIIDSLCAFIIYRLYKLYTISFKKVLTQKKSKTTPTASTVAIKMKRFLP